MIYMDDMGHLIADKNINELHEFATKIGLKRSWFQNKGDLSHYDLTTPNARRRAAAVGAIKVSSRELVRIRRGRRE